MDPEELPELREQVIGGSVDERYAVGVGKKVFVLGEDEDSLNQTPQRRKATREDREHELQDRLVRVPQVEVVGSEAAEEDSEESGSDSGFGLVAGRHGWKGRRGIVAPQGAIPPALLAGSVVIPTCGLILLCGHSARVTICPMG